MISANVDETAKFDVITLMDHTKVDAQTVAQASELNDNDFVTFHKDEALTETATIPLTGGTNGETTGTSYQEFWDKVECYSFNALGCLSTEETIKGLFVAFSKRLRDEM